MIEGIACCSVGCREPVVAIRPGAVAVYWPSRDLDDQDIGPAPLLLSRSIPDQGWCFSHWLAAFKRGPDASPSQSEEPNA